LKSKALRSFVQTNRGDPKTRVGDNSRCSLFGGLAAADDQDGWTFGIRQ
jgi:hypothetical protein